MYQVFQYISTRQSMKKILLLAALTAIVTYSEAQLLKKLKDKVNQSAKDVKTKVKEKAETAPDRVIDHTANKVQTKAETKIDNKENKANSKVDKTVDKVDSIKIKKQKADTITDTTAVKQTAAISKKNSLAGYERVMPCFFNETIFPVTVKPQQIILNIFYNDKKIQA